MKSFVPISASPDDRFIRVPEVSHITGLARATIYRKMKDGSFPQAVHVGPRFTAWTYSSVMSWFQDLVASQA